MIIELALLLRPDGWKTGLSVVLRYLGLDCVRCYSEVTLERVVLWLLGGSSNDQCTRTQNLSLT
jgi:hypothetical protein